MRGSPGRLEADVVIYVVTMTVAARGSGTDRLGIETLSQE